jgi:hypothetical protein
VVAASVTCPNQPYQSEVEKSVKSWRMTDMKKSRYSEEQIIGFLKQTDAGDLFLRISYRPM